MDLNDYRNSDKSTSFHDEEALIKAIQQGDAPAFKYLVKQYYTALSNFALQVVKSPEVAEDVVQDVFANIWEIREEWHPTESLKLYLYRAVKNQALNIVQHQRTEQKYVRSYIQEKEEPVIFPADSDQSDEFIRDVNAAIEDLPKRAQMVYKLHRRDGLTYKEIAKVMDISHKTVESQMSRALRILRKLLSHYVPLLLLAAVLEYFYG